MPRQLRPRVVPLQPHEDRVRRAQRDPQLPRSHLDARERALVVPSEGHHAAGGRVEAVPLAHVVGDWTQHGRGRNRVTEARGKIRGADLKNLKCFSKNQGQVPGFRSVKKLRIFSKNQGQVPGCTSEKFSKSERHIPGRISEKIQVFFFQKVRGKLRGADQNFLKK